MGMLGDMLGGGSGAVGPGGGQQDQFPMTLMEAMGAFSQSAAAAQGSIPAVGSNGGSQGPGGVQDFGQNLTPMGEDADYFVEGLLGGPDEEEEQQQGTPMAALEVDEYDPENPLD